MTVVRVVKVGGSLFSDSQLAAKLSRWMREQPPAINVLIAGGGGLADTVRDWNSRFDIEPVTAHWMCVDLLSISSQLLALLLPGSRRLICSTVTELLNDLREFDEDTVVFDPVLFVRTAEPRVAGVRLAIGWNVTSDSIAARIADCCRAQELVLLKSIDIPASAELPALAHQGKVDAFFPEAAQNLERIRFVNLRSFQL